MINTINPEWKELSDKIGVDDEFIHEVKEYYKIAGQARNDKTGQFRIDVPGQAHNDETGQARIDRTVQTSFAVARQAGPQ